jgi:hypothetical protein
MGDAGIGKSRLAHEFAQDLRAGGWRLIDVECSPNLQGAPYSALKRLLLSILDTAARDQTSTDDPRDALPVVQQRAVDAILDLPVSDPQWDELEPHARVVRFQTQAVRLSRASPVVSARSF